MEVPTIVSYSSLQGIVEQNADIPVPPGRGGCGGLQELLPQQDSTVFGGADHVDFPVPHGRGGRAGRGGLEGFSLGQGSTAFRGADHVDTPVPQGRSFVGGPQGFLPSSSGASSSHSPGAVDEA